MAKIQKNANLHEKTVKKIAESVIVIHPVKRPRRKTVTFAIGVRIWSDGVNPLIVEWVKQSGVDWRLSEIVSEDEIIIPRHMED